MPATASGSIGPSKAQLAASYGLVKDGDPLYLKHHLPDAVTYSEQDPTFLGIARIRNEQVEVEWQPTGEVLSLSKATVAAFSQHNADVKSTHAPGPYHWGNHDKAISQLVDDYLRQLGPRAYLNEILADYQSARQGPIKNHRMARHLRASYYLFGEMQALQDRPEIKIKGSAGKGNWGAIPHISFLNVNETTSPTDGVYPVYLFREDMSGAYITFNFGVTTVRNAGHPEGPWTAIAERRDELAEWTRGKLPNDWELDESIDLNTSNRLGREYEASTIAWKFYDTANLPSDEQIESDLQQVLQVYDDYVQAHPSTPDSTPEPTTATATVDQLLEALADMAEQRKLQFSKQQYLALLAGIDVQPFTLLAGPTGTGKTELASLLLGLNSFQGNILEVESGWLDSAAAFGFVSPATGGFLPGPVTSAILAATAGHAKHSLLILDEINVSPPHLYLAPLLSALEQAHQRGQPVEMRIAEALDGSDQAKALKAAAKSHDGLDLRTTGPIHALTLQIPPTLRVLGTLNFDSSTEDLAPKLLSRSMVVWFTALGVNEDLGLEARDVYGACEDDDPRGLLATFFEQLNTIGFPPSARAVVRCKKALDRMPDYESELVDPLLAGLMLPSMQEVTMQHAAGLRSFCSSEDLFDGCFSQKLNALTTRVEADGFASLWLV